MVDTCFATTAVCRCGSTTTLVTNCSVVVTAARWLNSTRISWNVCWSVYGGVPKPPNVAAAAEPLGRRSEHVVVGHEVIETRCFDALRVSPDEVGVDACVGLREDRPDVHHAPQFPDVECAVCTRMCASRTEVR